MPPKKKTRRKHVIKPLTQEQRVKALELPLRQRAAALSSIAAREENMRALTAMGLRADITRLEASIASNPNPTSNAVLNELNKHLKDVVKSQRAAR
jgi:hypothetical protein